MKTLQQKIEIMQAALRGELVEWICPTDSNDTWTPCYNANQQNWDWSTFDYRIAQPKKQLPLGPEDFPPGTIIRHAKRGSGYIWRSVNGVATDCVIFCATLIDNVLEIRYPTMTNEFERSLDGGKTWLPCYREE